MKTMEINKIIEDFDDYVKENRKFIYLNKAIEKFTTKDFPLNKVIEFSDDSIYQKGKKGKETFVRKVCSENLMATRVGQIFNTINKFFSTKDNFNIFRDFLKNLKKIELNKNKKEAIEKLVIESFDINNLISIRTVLIQILYCYLPSYFLPIYQLKKMRDLIKELKINLDELSKEEKRILESRKIKDFGKRLLIMNKLLVEWKNKNEKAKEWDNLMLAHFFYMCIPFEDLVMLRNSNLGIEWSEINEQFVVAIFMKNHQKLGFEKIINIRTSFPDCEVIDSEGNIKLIEFEFKSSSFLHHRDLATRCDFVICWEIDEINKIKEYNPKIKIISLKNFIR